MSECPQAKLVELGHAVANYRQALLNIRAVLRVQYLDARPFDNHERELATLRHLVATLWRALETVEQRP